VALTDRRLFIRALASLPLAASCLAESVPNRIEVAAFPAIDAVIKAAAQDLAPNAALGPIVVTSREFFDHHTALVTAMAGGSHIPDLVAIELSYLGRFMHGSALQVLEVPQANERIIPFAFKQGLDATGQLRAMPVDIAPATLFYRQDALLQAGIQETRLIASFDELVESGRIIKARTGRFLLTHARDLKDILIRTGLSAGEGVFISESDDVLVETPRFQKAFQLSLKVRQLELDARAKAWSSEWAEHLRRGSVVAHLMGSWFAGHLANWLAPKSVGLWRCTALPGGASTVLGGTFLAIPRGAKNPRAAQRLLEELTFSSQRQLRAFRDHQSFPVLLSAYSDPFFNQPIAYLGNQLARKIWLDQTLKLQQLPLHPIDAIASEIIDTALDDVLMNGVAIPDALRDAGALIRTRMHHWKATQRV